LISFCAHRNSGFAFRLRRCDFERAALPSVSVDVSR
jgi:hypothetical protein